MPLIWSAIFRRDTTLMLIAISEKVKKSDFHEIWHRSAKSSNRNSSAVV